MCQSASLFIFSSCFVHSLFWTCYGFSCTKFMVLVTLCFIGRQIRVLLLHLERISWHKFLLSFWTCWVCIGKPLSILFFWAEMWSTTAMVWCWWLISLLHRNYIWLHKFCANRMYSELISANIAEGGPYASRTSFVKLLRWGHMQDYFRFSALWLWAY